MSDSSQVLSQLVPPAPRNPRVPPVPRSRHQSPVNQMLRPARKATLRRRQIQNKVGDLARVSDPVEWMDGGELGSDLGGFRGRNVGVVKDAVEDVGWEYTAKETDLGLWLGVWRGEYGWMADPRVDAVATNVERRQEQRGVLRHAAHAPLRACIRKSYE